MVQKPKRRLPRWAKIILAMFALVMVMMCAMLVIVIFYPGVAAQNIDKLRDIIGDDAVAQLETTALNIQDQAQQLEYTLGLRKAEAPWSESPTDEAQVAQAVTSQPTLLIPAKRATATADPVIQAPTITPTPYAMSTSSASVNSTNTPIPMTPMLTPTLNFNLIKDGGLPTADSPVDPAYQSYQATLSAQTVQPTETEQPGPATQSPQAITPTSAQSSVVTATPSASTTTWHLDPLTPFGKLSGEGYWSPYLQADNGQMVAYRTFLEPDPHRPYSVTAIVAFDMQSTRLHFVLGTIEPIPLTPQPSRTGTIPVSDMQPGVLLATFNGGFKARHGHYGAMADGLVALPAINGLATVAMYSDGHVQMGEWGTDVVDSPDLVAWRQNGKLLVHRSQVTQDTLMMNELWGSTIKGDSITWRSAIGLSADGRVFYYAAGAQIDVATLAKAISRAGAAEALELDVNNYWVHFAAIRSNGTGLVAEPLLDAMNQSVDRYLKGWSRDFFYITAAPSTLTASAVNVNGQ